MKKNLVLSIAGLIFVLFCAQPVFSATDCNYFSASVKVGKPYTKIQSSVKAVTIYWAGVNVTINGNGQLVSTASNGVKLNYDNNNKRYRSLFFNGHTIGLNYTNNGSIRTISRSPGNIISFNYNKYGYLESMWYMGNPMRFYYNNDGSLRNIPQPVPVQCVYATFDGTL